MQTCFMKRRGFFWQVIFLAVGASVSTAWAVPGDEFWEAGPGLTAPVPFLPAIEAIAVSGSNLYVGGIFDSVAGVGATNIALWNGATWSPLGQGIQAFDVESILI